MSQFWIQRAGQVFGPFESARLIQLGAAGQIAQEDGVSNSPSGPWTPAVQVPGLFPTPALMAAAQLAPAPVPSRVPNPPPNRASAPGRAPLKGVAGSQGPSVPLLVGGAVAVLAILGFGVAILMMNGGKVAHGPSLAVGSDEEQIKQSKRQLTGIAIALHQYHDTFRVLPPEKELARRDDSGRPLLSWRVHLLPFIEEQELYRQFKLDEPWDSPHNSALVEQMPKLYRRPGSQAGPGRTCYLGIDGVGGAFEGGGGKGFHQFIDGTSNTAIIVEVNDSLAVEWTRPADYSYATTDPGAGLRSVWADGAQAILGDGRVVLLKRLDNTTDLLRLFQMGDGQVLRPELLTE